MERFVSWCCCQTYLKHLLQKKDSCRRAAKQKSCSSLWEKYRELRRKTKSIIYAKRKCWISPSLTEIEYKEVLVNFQVRFQALEERFFCKFRFGFLGFGFFGFVKQMERIVRIGIRLLFSRHFYNKFSVPLRIAVRSRYMLEGQKLKRNVES
jgi:hypothetical protein